MDKSLKGVLFSLVSALFLIGFLFCAFGFYLNWFSGIDAFFNSFMISVQSKLFTDIALIFHYIFEPVFVLGMLFIFSIFIWYKGFRNESLKLGLFIGIVALVSILLKNLFHRLRSGNMLINETSFSFPSGHSIVAVILFGLICYYAIYPTIFKFRLFERKFWKYLLYFISLLFVILIGFSRLYLNVHWFSDILAGWFLGLFLLFGFLFFSEGVNGKNDKKK